MDLNSLVSPEVSRERHSDEIDLVSEIHTQLSAVGWVGASTWTTEPEIMDAKTAAPVLARTLIARNLHSRFCGRLEDTRFERILLWEDCTHEQFVENVGKCIGPSLVKLYPAPPSERGVVPGVVACDEFGKPFGSPE